MCKCIRKQRNILRHTDINRFRDLVDLLAEPLREETHRHTFCEQQHTHMQNDTPKTIPFRAKEIERKN